MNGITKATLWGLGLAAPFVVLATLDYALPASPRLPAAETYFVGDAIYRILGAPLRLLVHPLFQFTTGREFYVYSDHLWILPLYDILYLVQWIIWAQFVRLIAVGIGYRRQSGTSNKASHAPSEPAPDAASSAHGG